MKGVKSTGSPSLIQTRKKRMDCPSLSDSPGRPLRSPSLRVSVEGTEAEYVQRHQSNTFQEEHVRRLAALGEKVEHLAHDIRNPLSSIEWLSTLLGQEDHSTEVRKELAGQCIQAVRSLDHLVSNILVFSVPLQSARDSVDLFSVLNDVELLAMYPLQQKGVTIHRHWNKQVLRIQGHEALLKQGILNLLMNAISASEQGSAIEVYCSHESRFLVEDGEPCLKNGTAVRIRDHGCGMSKQERSQMYRPFYSMRKGGTGLGLSIVKQIVHIHHGLIDITSQQGKGTTVDLFFPQ